MNAADPARAAEQLRRAIVKLDQAIDAGQAQLDRLRARRAEAVLVLALLGAYPAPGAAETKDAPR